MNAALDQNTHTPHPLGAGKGCVFKINYNLQTQKHPQKTDLYRTFCHQAYVFTPHAQRVAGCMQDRETAASLVAGTKWLLLFIDQIQKGKIR